MRKLLIGIVALATVLTQITAEKFSCEGRASGYYADVDTGCQIYHMCDGLGRQFSYSCPNTTLFQQRMLICDHWYMVNCSKSEVDYKANLLIGQKDKPFVEDSSEHPYHRTPRPDLLQQPYAPQFQDNTPREGRAQSLSSSLNLVGVATDDDAEDENGNRKNFTTARPQYFLPSHWSTQYGKSLTTPIPKVNNIKTSSLGNNKSPSISDKKFPSFESKNSNIPVKIPPVQNFNNNQKFFKEPIRNEGIKNINTINPRIDNVNIPDSVNQESVSPSTLALPPFVPLQPKIVPQPSQAPQKISEVVTRPSASNPKPALPTLSQNPFIPPLLPQIVPTIPSPRPFQLQPQSQSQLQPLPLSRPQNNFNKTVVRNDTPVQRSNKTEIPAPSIYYEPPKLSSRYDVESSTMDPQTFYKLVPSKDLLPPPFEAKSSANENDKTAPPKILQTPTINPRTGPTTEKSINKKEVNEETDVKPTLRTQTAITEKRWKELRQMFFIPEYDFPLETGNRPSYEGGLSSFQVNPAPPNPEAYRQSEARALDSRFQSRNNDMKFTSNTQQNTRSINPDCPKCDPAFLAPGTCKPCVMIRR